MTDSKRSQSAAITAHSEGPALPFPVVGIGASAGGLEALQDLFSGLHRDSPMAYVVIQHLSPDFKSMMLEILGRHTALTVVLPEDGTAVAPGQVYLIPPTQDLTIEGARIRLTPRQEDGGLHHPIDLFLESLARAQRELAVAVILSGTGTDGSRGSRAVHQAGGTVIVQEPSSAKFDGMPRSAVATGVADLVLSAFAIAEQLNEWPGALEASPGQSESEPLNQLFQLVAQETRVDLSVYKEGTLIRRIHRRMQVTERSNMRSYADLVAASEPERKALSSDLLIGVTEFFRDNDAWSWLSEHILYQLVDEWAGELRMWVVGCSTGCEAYTLAMLVNEVLEARGLERTFRIFATDANGVAIKEAMAGTYDEALMASVPQDMRERYFRNVGEAWTVRRFLRDRITFAVHNVITDPPFTRLSLVTCRNMLIYLRPEAQRPVIARMHFGLHEGGVLMLGSSETVGDRKGYFEALNLKWKVFRARGSSSELASLFGGAIGVVRQLHDTAPRRNLTPKGHTQAATDFYIPPGVGVDAAFEIQHFFGHVTPYLKLPEGRANLNLLNMLPPAVSVFVSSTARRVRASEEAALIPSVELESDLVDIRILLSKQNPLDQGERGLLVFFEKSRRSDVATSPSLELSDASRERISRLEDELMVTRENLRTAVEDLEAANEELQATNEELIASNEELQSTNEELQSVNEELFSVNTEYQEKIEELEFLANDLENLLRSIDVGALFLDNDLRVRRFNDTVLRLIPLKAQDIGRDFDDFTMRVEYPSMRDDLVQVRDGASARSTELVAPDGVHWRVTIRKFEGGHRQVAGGVIVTFHDATTVRMQQNQIGDLAANAVAVGLAGVGVMVVDSATHYVRLSEVAEQLLGVGPDTPFGFEEVRALLESPAGEQGRDKDGIVRAGDALRTHERADGSQVLLRTFAQRATNANTDTEQLIVVLQEVR